MTTRAGGVPTGPRRAGWRSTVHTRRSPVTATLALLVASLLAATGAAATSSAAGAATNSHDGPCAATEGVTVVVDATVLGGPTVVRCAVGAQATGWKALQNAGFAVTSVPQFPNTAVCTIDQRPSQGYPYCWTTGFWSYWNASTTNVGSKWKMSSTGAAIRVPALGSVEGWSFTLGQAKAPSVGPAFQRAVDVHLSQQEETRLQQLAVHYGETPAGIFRMGVGVTAFLFALNPAPPSAANLTPPGTAVTHHLLWQPEDVKYLDAVKAQFLLNDEDANRFGYYLVSFISALNGF